MIGSSLLWEMMWLRKGMGKGKEGDGKREREDGKGRRARARHVCVPINKKKLPLHRCPLTSGSAPGPRWGLRSPSPTIQKKSPPLSGPIDCMLQVATIMENIRSEKTPSQNHAVLKGVPICSEITHVENLIES